MRKYNFLWVLLVATLCGRNVTAQPVEHRTLTIDQMFSLAEENNRQLQLQSTRIDEAKEGIGIARDGYLPSIGASLSLSYNGDGTIMDRNFSHSFTAPIPSFGNNFALEVSQVLYAGGAIKSRVEIAGLHAQLAALNAEQQRDEVHFLIAGNSLEICKIKNQLQVYESHIMQTNKMLENMQLRHQEGTVLHNDITRYELQLQNLTHSKTQLLNRRQVLNNQLTSALGLPRSVLVIPDRNSLRTGMGGDIESPAASPLLKMADAKIKTNHFQEKIARSERLPKVALFAANYLNGPVTIDIPALDKNFNYWAVGVGITYNIGSLYSSPKKIRASRIAQQRAVEEKAVVEEQLHLALDAATIGYREAHDLHATREKSVELATRNYEVIRYRYENDLALMTDLLDASTQKLEAELQEVNARIDILYRYYKLKYISGTI